MNSLKRIMPYLKPYWKEILLSIVALTFVVGAELLIPMQIQRIIDDGIAQNDMQVVLTSTLLMFGLALFAMILTFVNIVYATRVSEGFAADIREMAFRKIQSFSFANLDKLQTGDLLVRLTSDNNIVKMAVTMTLRMVFRAPLMLFGSLILLIITSPRLALTLLVLLPATVGLIIWFSSRTEPMYKKVQARLDRVNTIMQENIAGARVVRAFVRADHENERFGDANERYMERAIEVNQLVAMLLPSMIVLLNLGMTAIIWFGGVMTINDEMTTGELVAFTNYLMTTMIPVLMLGMILPQLYASEASVSRMMEIMDTDTDVTDKTDAQDLVITEGRVVFDNVSLDYDGEGGNDPVLCNVSFTAEPGQTVAILGATGSGKSSLINLIPRFYNVSDGQIRIDGMNTQAATKESLRKQIGFALQEAILFSGTVRDNIRYGRPEATDEEVIAAAQAAQAHEFIVRKAEGYDSEVSQRGTNFSGGQKQRIAIARALCTDPRILILDDSTSAVDVETEVKIQAALADLLKGRTSFIVAQRISTVLDADKIIVLENGRIVAEGTHEELFESSPIYQEIYQSQLGDGSGKEVNYA